MRGYSLLEVLIATSIVATGIAAFAHLTLVAAYANLHARQTTVAAILAQQKMEELLPGAASGSLTPSPGDTLRTTVEGFADIVDGVYLRRWSIDPLAGSPHNTSVLRVLVTDLRNRDAMDHSALGIRLAGEARLVGTASAKP